MRLKPALILSLATSFCITPSSFASLAKISTWKAGTPALHGAVKDQGDVGFCWANAWTSYLESKIMIEKNKSIDLSAMFVGRAHMANEFVETLEQMNHGKQGEDENLNVLTHYQDLAKDPVSLAVTKNLLIRKFQRYSENELEGFTFARASQFGVVPKSVYEKDTYQFPLGPIAGTFPPYVNRYYSPEYQSKFQTFIQDHLLNPEDMNRYLGDDGKMALERDFDLDNGNHSLAERDAFTFEGKEYNSHTFLTQYIGFNPSDFQMKPLTIADIIKRLNHETIEPTQSKSGYADETNFDEVIAGIQKELDQRHPVLLSMLLFDDVDSNPNLTNEGVLAPENCISDDGCKSMGGHAVMIVNSMKDETGKVTALIIQNSWGPQGTNDQGIQTKVRAKRGFNIVTLDYLREAMHHRDYAFSYMFI